MLEALTIAMDHDFLSASITVLAIIGFGTCLGDQQEPMNAVGFPQLEIRYEGTGNETWDKESLKLFETEKPSLAGKYKSRIKATIRQNIRSKHGRILRGKTRWKIFKKTPPLVQKRILCDLKRLIPSRYFKYSKGFSQNPFAKYLPKTPEIPVRGSFRSCAVVSSAGTLIGSGIGSEIDSYDQVCRMNKAPVIGYSKDVGSKTTLRIINDQMLVTLNDPSNPFWGSRIQQKDLKHDILLGWDFCGFKNRLPLHKCHDNLGSANIRKSEGYGHQGFVNYLKFRKHHPRNRVFVLQLEWIRMISDFLKRHSPVSMSKNSVPSTGFVGLVFLMHHCKTVDVFHMIPPKRGPGRCKYFEDDYNSPIRCSLFPGHSRETEVSFLMAFNMANDKATYLNGRATIPGLVDLKC